jgi:hypothetical protein
MSRSKPLDASSLLISRRAFVGAAGIAAGALSSLASAVAAVLSREQSGTPALGTRSSLHELALTYPHYAEPIPYARAGRNAPPGRAGDDPLDQLLHA